MRTAKNISAQENWCRTETTEASYGIKEADFTRHERF